MSVFSRIASNEINPAKPKIPVWPIMMDLTRVMDGDITFAALAELYSLDAEEQAEMAEYMQAIGAIITDEVGERMRIGMGQAYAIRDARVSVDTVLRYALLRIEQGTLTLEAFRSQLGLPRLRPLKS